MGGDHSEAAREQERREGAKAGVYVATGRRERNLRTPEQAEAESRYLQRLAEEGHIKPLTQRDLSTKPPPKTEVELPTPPLSEGAAPDSLGCRCFDSEGRPTKYASEMEQIAASLGKRWEDFYVSIHKGGQTRFFIGGVEDLMRSLALREAAVDQLSKSPSLRAETAETQLARLQNSIKELSDPPTYSEANFRIMCDKLASLLSTPATEEAPRS